jgi:anti-anti-sigma regulatory factor
VKKKYALTGAVTIYTVGTLRSQFEVWIAKLPKGPRGAALNDSPLAVDAQGVDEIDAAGMQLLVSLAKDSSSLLVGACEALGVASLLLHPASNSFHV